MPRGADFFLILWASLWTAAVTVVQHQAITTAGPTVELLFLFTHGGAELAVLYLLSNSLVTDVDEQGGAIALERDHAGLVARWTRGSHSPGGFALQALALAIAHVALMFGALVSGLSAPSPLWGWTLALVALAVWGASARRSARSVAHARREGGDVTLTADLDGIRVREPAREVVSGWEGLHVEAFEGMLRLETPDTLLRIPCQDTPARAELVAALHVMAATPRPKKKSRRVPAALDRLRRAERDLK